jgi:hypothetical protein
MLKKLPGLVTARCTNVIRLAKSPPSEVRAGASDFFLSIENKKCLTLIFRAGKNGLFKTGI